jgi:hypothetical protein
MANVETTKPNLLPPPTCGAAKQRGGGAHVATQRQKKESPSFLKKRSKRLLFPRNSLLGGRGRYLAAGAGIKVFLLLFLQKKKALLTSP